jgi:preprotein translocase SecF subunit
MNFTHNYKKWFTISAAIILLGLILSLVNGVNVGIDFSGGTMMQFDLGEEVQINAVEDLIDEFDLNPEIIHAGDENHEIIIRTKKSLSNEERVNIFNNFKDEYNLEDSAFLGAEQFGPSVGAEIQERALISILLAGLGMLAYISFRFQVLYGLSAIVALIHDVLILLSVYAILRIPINSSFIAAVLTVVGYSINDTIVIFDRIRENVRKVKKKSFMEIANISLNQTINRSINTSLTTLLVIGSLFVLGTPAIKEFATPLLVGVLAGTYSSIFIAAPTWALIKEKRG